MLSQALLDAIEDNLQQLYVQIPLNDIIYQLHARKVLSEGEVDFLSECKPKQKQNYEFIKILRTREDRDYKEFCELLIKHQTEAVQNLGKALKSKLQTTLNSGQTTGHNNKDEVNFSRALVIVSNKIGNDWSRLATFLYPEMDTDVIRDQNPYNVFNQAKEALKLWSHKYPSDATVANLKDSLREINRNDIIIALENSRN